MESRVGKENLSTLLSISAYDRSTCSVLNSSTAILMFNSIYILCIVFVGRGSARFSGRSSSIQYICSCNSV